MKSRDCIPGCCLGARDRILIFKYGREYLTVKRIAAEVGISEAVIYRHFKSKKSIVILPLNHIAEKIIGLGDRTLNKQTSRTIDKQYQIFFMSAGVIAGVGTILSISFQDE